MGRAEVELEFVQDRAKIEQMEPCGKLRTTLEKRFQEVHDAFRAEGEERGPRSGLERERQLLVRQTKRQFGNHVAVPFATLLAEVDSWGRLHDVGDWIVDYATGSELLARLQGIKQKQAAKPFARRSRRPLLLPCPRGQTPSGCHWRLQRSRFPVDGGPFVLCLDRGRLRVAHLTHQRRARIVPPHDERVRPLRHAFKELLPTRKPGPNRTRSVKAGCSLGGQCLRQGSRGLVEMPSLSRQPIPPRVRGRPADRLCC